MYPVCGEELGIAHSMRAITMLSNLAGSVSISADYMTHKS